MVPLMMSDAIGVRLCVVSFGMVCVSFCVWCLCVVSDRGDRSRPDPLCVLLCVGQALAVTLPALLMRKFRRSTFTQTLYRSASPAFISASYHACAVFWEP